MSHEPDRPERGLGRWHGAIVVLLPLLAALATLYGSGQAGKPPGPGDGPDYENIAFHLVRGEGFAVDFGNPEWRAPYVEHNGSGRYDELLGRDPGRYATAYRPPLLPLLVAATWAGVGRSFLAWQLLGCLIFAATVALAASLARRHGGVVAGLVTAAVGSASNSLRASAPALMTECLAAACVVALVWALQRLDDRPGTGRAGACGVVLGIAVLARSIFALWLPLVPLLVAALAARGGGPDRLRRGLMAGAAAALSAGLVLLPWAVRNATLLGAFLPFGSQAAINLPAGWSDRAVALGGVWQAPDHGELRARFAAEGRSGTALEARLAREGSGQALAWLRAHPAAGARLAALKVLDAWWPRGRVHRVLLPACLVSALVLVVLGPAPRRRFVLGLLALLAMNALAVAATWSMGWRFNVPVELLLCILFGLGAAAQLERMTGLARPTAIM